MVLSSVSHIWQVLAGLEARLKVKIALTQCIRMRIRLGKAQHDSFLLSSPTSPHMPAFSILLFSSHYNVLVLLGRSSRAVRLEVQSTVHRAGGKLGRVGHPDIYNILLLFIFAAPHPILSPDYVQRKNTSFLFFEDRIKINCELFLFTRLHVLVYVDNNMHVASCRPRNMNTSTIVE